jgi:DNA mismatch repair protein MutL
VTVSELFQSVPARLKFLKAPATEYTLAAETIRRFALVHPQLHVRVVRNGKLAFDLPPVTDLRTRIRQVLGRELGSSMTEFRTRYGGMEIEGALSPAGVSFGTARRIALFVNDRLVHDRLLFRAVIDGYRTYLLKGRFPAVVLLLSVDPARVDVNVHPAKTEVRFAEPDQVQRFVVESIRDTLRGGASPLGRWGLSEDDLLKARARGTTPGTRQAPVEMMVAEEPEAAEAPPGYRASAVPQSTVSPAEPIQLGLGTAEPDAAFKVLGQVFRGYIVCQTDEGLVLIDQHAAHERLLFERLKEAYAAGAIASQRLLAPAIVTVGEVALEQVAENGAALAQLGWEIEPFGDREVAVRAVPELAVGADLGALVERLVTDLVRTQPEEAAQAAAERILATVACHSAIRAGADLSPPAIRDLLRQVRVADFAASCPHGRPVARVMSRAQLERWFGR